MPTLQLGSDVDITSRHPHYMWLKLQVRSNVYFMNSHDLCFVFYNLCACYAKYIFMPICWNFSNLYSSSTSASLLLVSDYC